uniref:Ig-like domain-containing protein n=1 Tax=Balaenoptera musculus TaxID=9771 RepID=A0A8C0HZA3_BALMU
MGMFLKGLLIILWLQLTSGMSGQQLNQSPRFMSIQEGEDVSMNCNSSSTLNLLLWYKQDAGGAFTFLFILISTGIEKKSGRLRGTLDRKELLSTLHITATKPGDSATYLCAVEAQCSLVTCSRFPNATAEPPATVRWVTC